MNGIILFSAGLFVAALISELAHRSIVSTTVFFLLVGFVAGPDVTGIIQFSPDSQILSRLAEFAMFAVLFTDGMELGKKDILRAWRLPSRALGLGLPLTIVGTAIAAHFVAGLEWLDAFLVGAVLAPTDPVFASAVVGRREIPARLRDLLNIESGMNDGLALPIVIALLGLRGGEHESVWMLLEEIVLGVALGIGVPWLGHRIEGLKWFGVSKRYEPLFPLSLGLLVYAFSSLTHANEFLAAFFSGVTIASLRSRFRAEFRRFGEIVSDLLKLATVLVFGAQISPEFLREVPASGYVFALIALVAVRPLALEIALRGERLTWRERISAYWFGPKGFASIVYGLLVLQAGVPNAGKSFHLIAIVVAASIIAHSSTDVLVARWFANAAEPARDRGT